MSVSAELPPGWAIAPLEEVADILDNRRKPINRSERATRIGSVPYYGATGQAGWIDGYLFDEELVLLGEDGAPFLETSKPKAYMIRGRSWVNNHAHVLRAGPFLCNSFLLHQLNVLDYRPYVSGTTRLKLPQGPMRQIPVILPPLAEQRRIVAEIETQFARLDAAEAALERARAKLAFHRELIFRKLLSGDDIETPFAAHGLLELQNVTPMGWTWTTLDEIAEVRGGLAKGSKRAPLTPTRQVPYLRVANVQRGWLDLEEIKLIDATEADIATLRLVNGDVLFNEGGDRDKLGRGWVWEGQMPGVIHQNHVFRARLRPDTMIPRFLSLFVNTFGQSFFMSVGKQTTNLASVSLSNLRRLPIPVPDLVTQQSILEKVDQYASTQEQLYTTINVGLHKSETIRQSILQRAFSGQLVPQDLAEEPASVLLERIAAERASTAPPRRKAGTRRTKATSVEVQRGLL